MPLVLLKHVYVGLVLEHPLRSLELSCMAEGPFGDVYIFVVDFV